MRSLSSNDSLIALALQAVDICVLCANIEIRISKIETNSKSED